MDKRMKLKGTVVHGQGLGRQFGVPTANLALENGQALPPRGVYASMARIDGQTYAGVTNVGARPTVSSSGEETIETFLIGYDGDLYGRTLELTLCGFLREIRRFDGLEALRAQIAEDQAHALRFLK